MSYKTVIEVGGEKRIIAGSSKEAVERAIKMFYGGSNSKGADESKSAEPKKTIEYSTELEHPVTKEKITLKASSKDELKTSIERKAKELYGSFSEVREVDSGFEIITKVPESYEPFVRRARRRASKTEFTIPRTPEEAVNYPKSREVKVSVSETFEKPKNFSVPSSVKLVEKPYELEPTPKTESFGSSVQKASEKIEKAVSDRAAPMRFLTGVAVGAGTAVLAPAIIAETVATSSKPVKSLTEGVALWASSVPLRLASKDPFLMGTAVGELGSVAISPKFTPKVFRSIKTVSEVYTGFSRTGSPELVFKSTKRGILGDTSKIGILKEELISRETGKEVPILEFERERGFLFPLVEEGGALKPTVKKVKTEPKTEAPSVTPMLKIPEIFPMSKTVVVGTKSDVGSKISALKIETPSPDVLRGRYLRFEGTPENFLVRAEERSVRRVATEVRKSRIRKTVEVKGDEIRTSGFIERGQSIQKNLVIGYEKASGKVTKKPITEKYRVSYQEIDLSVPKVTMHSLAPFTRTKIIPTPDVTKIYRGFRDYTVKSYTTEFSAGLPLIGFSLFNGLKPSPLSVLKTELKTTPKNSLKLKEVPVEIGELKPTEKPSIFTKTTEKTGEVLKFTPKTSAKTTSSLKTPQTTTSIEVPTIPPNRVGFFPAFGGKEGSKLKKLGLKFKGFSLKTDVVPLADWYAVTATEIMFKKTPRVRRPEKKAEYKEKMERLGFALTFPTQEIEKIMKKKGGRKK